MRIIRKVFWSEMYLFLIFYKLVFIFLVGFVFFLVVGLYLRCSVFVNIWFFWLVFVKCKFLVKKEMKEEYFIENVRCFFDFLGSAISKRRLRRFVRGLGVSAWLLCFKSGVLGVIIEFRVEKNKFEDFSLYLKVVVKYFRFRSVVNMSDVGVVVSLFSSLVYVIESCWKVYIFLMNIKFFLGFY